MLHRLWTIGWLCFAVGALSASTSLAADPPHVVFVTGDCEYRSEVTMPMLADIVRERYGMRTSICYAVNPQTGEREPKSLQSIAGLEALANADLAVFFVRFRQLPPEQLQMILDYAHSGRPLVGFRTTTHAFRYEQGDEMKWNDGFGRDVFGQQWFTHHGHDSSTNVYVCVDDHPIIRGVSPEFHCRSWLYQVMPLHGDCRPLLIGSAVKGEEQQSETFGTPNPVAWTKTTNGARVFFTTLGHPDDFTLEPMRRLSVQGIFWALGREDEIPAEGLNVETISEYIAPPTTQAVPDPVLEQEGQLYAAGEEGNPIGLAPLALDN